MTRRDTSRLGGTAGLGVLAAWSVPGLILASRIPSRFPQAWIAELPLLMLAGVVAVGALVWVGSGLGLARVRRMPLGAALRADASTYVGWGLGLPCLAGVLPAGVSLAVSAGACVVAKGLLWRWPARTAQWAEQGRLPFAGLAMVALLFSLPNLFSSRSVIPALAETVASRDLSYEEKMAEKWPDLYPQAEFIRSRTPADAMVELPPHVMGPAESPVGQAALLYYFLRPRKLVQSPFDTTRSAFPDAYTLVAYGRFLPNSENRVIWPRELPRDRILEPMPREISLYLDEIVGKGPLGEFLRVDFEQARAASLRRLWTDTKSTVVNRGIADRGHPGARSEVTRVRYEAGSIDEWGLEVDAAIGPGHSLRALLLSNSEGSARLFVEARVGSGEKVRLYSEPNSIERWWDTLRIDDLREKLLAASRAGPSEGSDVRLTLVGLQILPHLERWGLIMPRGVGR